MDARARDRHRQFQGSRFLAAYNGARKKMAARLKVSVQAIDRHANGRAAAISYEQVAELAADPQANPYSVVSGVVAVIEEARACGDAMQLAERLHDLLHLEQQRDGLEDVSQQKVAAVLGAIPFMSDNLTVAFRRKATAELDAWIEAQLATVDAALAAIGTARALRTKLAPTEVH